MELRSEIKSMNKDNSQSRVRTSHGFKTSWSRIWTTMNRKPQKCSSKNMRRDWMRVDFACRSKAKSETTKTRICQLIHKNYTYWEKELGLILNQKNSRYPIFQCRRKWFVFFVMEVYLETMMERLKSGGSKDNCKKHFLYFHHWSDEKWKKTHGKRRRKQEKIPVLYWIHQEQSCTSELFKVTQDAVSLIRHYRTMWLLRATSSSTFIMSDVQSIYIPSSIRTSILLWGKDWSSIRLDRTLSFFYATLPACCNSESCSMENGEVKNEKVFASPRPPPKISLKHEWKKRIGFRSCSTTRGRSCSTISTFPIKPTESKPRFMIERGNPLFALKEEHPVHRKSKHVHFVKKLWNIIERWNPLSAVMKITSTQLLSALSKRLIHVSLVKVRT